VAALDARAGDEDGDVVVVGEDFGGESGDGVLGGEVGRVDCCFCVVGEGVDGLFGCLVGCVALGSEGVLGSGTWIVDCGLWNWTG
jgi:hypothetical protein